MTALTLPRCLVSSSVGHAYPFRSDLCGESATLLSYVPQLPDGYHWAEGPEVHGPSVRLDAEAVALLLYASGLDPMVSDDEAVISAVHVELGDTHSTQHARVVLALDAEQDAEFSAARLRACRVRACLLCQVEA